MNDLQKAADLNSTLLILIVVLVTVSILVYRFRPKRKTMDARTTTAAQNSAAVPEGSTSATLSVLREAYFLDGARMTSVVKWGLRIITLLFIGAMVASWIFDYEIPLFHNQLTGPHLFMMIALLVLAVIFIPKGKGKTTAALALSVVVVALIGYGFEEAITKRTRSVDRGVNHGDWSDPADYTRTISNGTVTIQQGGFDRFRVIGSVKIRNAGIDQCMHPRPATPHTYRDLGNKYLVFENDGTPIYTMSWSTDGRTYLIELASDRTETITVTTVPVGQPGCKYVGS